MKRVVEAVVDRISESTYAVFLAEKTEEEFVISIDEVEIPLREGLWVELHVDDEGTIKKIVPNEVKTKEKAETIENIMTRLRKRKGSNFKL
ncbi:MAG TPA: DUF3006 family protein [Pseudogracilibacillus sp.]|nr:DUF3006 family protein [Pseudogracilibacillus sp.]